MNLQAPPYALAADIGGTKIRVGLVSQQGQLLHAATVASDAQKGAAAVLKSLTEALDRLAAKAVADSLPITGVGVSTAGVVDSANARVIFAGDTMPDWTGTDFRASLARYGVPVQADNDVNAALLGELWLGGCATEGLTMMLTLGTGLGGGLAVDGAILPGPNQVSGHVGHALVWNPYESRYTLLEHLVSGSGLCNIDLAHRRRTEAAAQKRSGQVIIAAFAAGEPLAQQALAEWADHLARVLHNLYWLLDPQLIVVGGGMIHSREHWWPLLAAALAELHVKPALKAALLGNDAGVIGAGKLVFDRAPPTTTIV